MKGLIRSFLVALWFMVLTFPILVIKVSPLDGSISWRYANALYLGTAIFFLSFVWRGMLVKKGIATPEEADLEWFFSFAATERHKDYMYAILLLAAGTGPLLGAWILMPAAQFFVWAKELSTGFAGCVLLACAGIGGCFSCLQGKRAGLSAARKAFYHKITSPGPVKTAMLALLLICLLPIPYLVDMYQLNIMASAFIWIMLGLGLNIVVGQAGMLVLGYVAFYAVGAYTYAVCNQYFAGPFIGFWILLPLGGLLALLAGVLLSLPVLRLRGDYLAIVTLGFGEIVRVTLEVGSLSLEPFLELLPESVYASLPAWTHHAINLGGPAGIANIPYPGFFGLKLSMDDSIRYVYYIALALTIVTIFCVARLRDSRIGRSWMALREDEIACEAMGINKVSAKLSAFALGACWAGFGGVLFAAKTSFINPTSFTFMESALILSVVVLGGLGSIVGVAVGACVLILLPEYLRAMNEYRMLIFGASMVLMMVFRPQGLIPPQMKQRLIPEKWRKPQDREVSAS